MEKARRRGDFLSFGAHFGADFIRFLRIQANVVTYNATLARLELMSQWRPALELFELSKAAPPRQASRPQLWQHVLHAFAIRNSLEIH